MVSPDRSIVLVAHSKGAVEALLVCIEHWRFVKERVKAVFLVQGAFGGSHLANYLAGDGPSPDGRMPFALRVAFHLAAKVLNFWTARSQRGLVSMTLEATRVLWEGLAKKALVRVAEAAIGHKVFYITSYEEDYTAMVHPLSSAGCYLTTYFGSNDGVVLLDHQSVPLLGRLAAKIRSFNHADLFVSKPFSKKNEQVRFAFTYALLDWVGVD